MPHHYPEILRANPELVEHAQAALDPDRPESVTQILDQFGFEPRAAVFAHGFLMTNIVGDVQQELPIEEAVARARPPPDDKVFTATGPCWSIGIGGCDDSMKFRMLSSGCKSGRARGEPARVGSEPGDGLGNEAGEA